MTFRSRPLLDLARGQDCLAEIHGVCNRDPSTVVSAHRNGGGMGTKADDFLVAWCCSACHDYIDARTHREVPAIVRDLYWQRAHEATLRAMFERGLIQVTGHSPKTLAPVRIPKILPRVEYRR